jgi:hypothetical protein
MLVQHRWEACRELLVEIHTPAWPVGWIQIPAPNLWGAREDVTECGGVEVSTEGDSFFVVFRTPAEALRAAIEIQRALAEQANRS